MSRRAVVTLVIAPAARVARAAAGRSAVSRRAVVTLVIAPAEAAVLASRSGGAT